MAPSSTDGLRLRQPHEVGERDCGPHGVELGVAGGEVRGDRGEDVAAVEGGVVTGSHRSRFVSSRASIDATERIGRRRQQPVVGTDEHVAAARRGWRSAGARCPTPGSTTPTWTPTGTYGSAKRRRKAPSRIANFRIVWPTSMIWASRQIASMTPLQVATAPSRPKSVRNAMIGRSLGCMARILAVSRATRVSRCCGRRGRPCRARSGCGPRRPRPRPDRRGR